MVIGWSCSVLGRGRRRGSGRGKGRMVVRVEKRGRGSTVMVTGWLVGQRIVRNENRGIG